MSMGEGSALGVLSDEADGRPSTRGFPGRAFPRRPSRWGFSDRHLAALIKQVSQLGMDGETFGDLGGAFADFSQGVGLDLGDGGPVIAGPGETFPDPAEGRRDRGDRLRLAAWARASSSRRRASTFIASSASGVTTPSAINRWAYRSRTGVLAAISRAMTGWVKLASSVSLWPFFR